MLDIGAVLSAEELEMAENITNEYGKEEVTLTRLPEDKRYQLMNNE